ncbi:MAG: RHS repeat protein [Chitinophagaceae bacterium]|nr:RHS repeat protein [Chitinophagaceae bacterium]
MAELRKYIPVVNKPSISNSAFQHVGKHFDFVLGIDFHWTTLPFLWIPLPLPHPFVGIIFDPMDYIHFNIPIPSFLQGAAGGATSIPMGGSVYIFGRHKATTTTSVMGVAIPWAHVTGLIPVYFIVDKPMAPHEGEVYYGSDSVLVQGCEMGGNQPQHVLTCWSPPMGLTPLPTMPGKIKKNPLAYFAFYSRFLKLYIQINTGAPVLVGGSFQPHKYTLGEYLMRFAGMAIMRALTKAIGKALSKSLKALNTKMLQPAFGKTNKVSKGLCAHGFEPVNFVTGEMEFEWDDFELPGSTTFKCANSWQSQSPFPNMFGRGVFNSMDLSIIAAADKTFAVWKHPQELMPVHIPYMEPGEEAFYFREQKIWIERTENNGWLVQHNQTKYYYHPFQDPEFGEIFRVQTVACADGTEWQFTYHPTVYNVLASVTEKSGKRLELALDPSRKKVAGITYQYNETNQELVRYEYDERGNLTHVYDQHHNAIVFDYDAHNRVVNRTNRNGQQYWWRYDAEDRVVETSGANGFQHGQLVYHPQEGYNEIIYPQIPGKTEKIYYDENSLIDYRVDALGGETWYDYTRFNERKMEASPEGRTIGYDYDEWGNIAVYHMADGEQISYAYNEFGQLLSRTDAGGKTEKWQYDAQQRLVKYTAKNKVTVAYFYNGNAKLPASAKDSNGLEMHWQYNSFGLPLEMTTSEGRRVNWDYDDFGRLLRETTDTAVHTHWKRDALGRVRAIYESGQLPLKIKYDAYDLPVHASDGREEWFMEYTPMGSLRKQVRQGMLDKTQRGTLHFNYDDYENLTTIRNEKGETYRFIRNANDEVVEEIGFDGQKKSYRRNADGFVTHALQNNGAEIFYDYDSGGRLVYTHYADGFWEGYEYDKTGLLAEAANPQARVKFMRNALGQVVEEEQEHGHRVQYNYDAQGRLTGLSSSLGAAVQYNYHNLGYLEQVSARCGNGKHWHMQLQLTEKGQQQERSYTGGVNAVLEYDHTGQPISQKVTAGGKSTLFTQYRWQEGNRLANTLNVLTNERTWYDYDSFGSLVSASYANNQTIYKNPDETGNIYRTANRTDRRYGKGGKLLRDEAWFYHYDALGNLVLKTPTPERKDINWQAGDWAYQWQANGMLAQVIRPDGKPVQFEYDALGRRTAKIFDGTVNRYVWDGNVLLHEWSYEVKDRPKLIVQEDGQLLYDRKEAAENIVTWIYNTNSFAPDAKLVGEKQYSIISDYLGTPVEAYDETGKNVWHRELDCYGQVRKGDNDFVPFLYQGQYWDEETELAYNRFRYYDVERGNYISKDPFGLAGTGFNMYSYCKNINLDFDPFGLECWSTARKKFWKAEADANPRKYSTNNLARMKQGKAPRMTVEVFNPKTMRTEIKDVSMELHHTWLPQRGAGQVANESWNLTKASPWAHASMDPYRFTGNDLIRIIKGTNTW